MSIGAEIAGSGVAREGVPAGRGGAEFWFPGRWLGGAALVLGPLLLLAGVLVRFPYGFFFPEQLAAFASHPGQLTTGYSLFAAGNVVLCFAVAALAVLIGRGSPGWAAWGGALTILGLFARTFSAGVDHLAFQLVDVQDLQTATKAVADSYGAWHVFGMITFTKMFGWLALAIGSYRSRTLGLPRALSLALMAALMGGTLKGSTLTSALAAGGLCVALVPLGVELLRGRVLPR